MDRLKKKRESDYRPPKYEARRLDYSVCKWGVGYNVSVLVWKGCCNRVTTHLHLVVVVVKKHSRYRPGVAQRVPGS